MADQSIPSPEIDAAKKQTLEATQRHLGDRVREFSEHKAHFTAVAQHASSDREATDALARVVISSGILAALEKMRTDLAAATPPPAAAPPSL